MFAKGIPILLTAAFMLIVGAWKLITDDATKSAAAGVLFGAGLVLLSAWLIAELWDRKK